MIQEVLNVGQELKEKIMAMGKEANEINKLLALGFFKGPKRIRQKQCIVCLYRQKAYCYFYVLTRLGIEKEFTKKFWLGKKGKIYDNYEKLFKKTGLKDYPDKALLD